MNGLPQTWRFVELKDKLEKKNDRLEEENDRLHGENYRLSMEIGSLHRVVDDMQGEAAPLMTPGGDIECGKCAVNLGLWETATEYNYCPYCGAHIDWEGARSCS